MTDFQKRVGAACSCYRHSHGPCDCNDGLPKSASLDDIFEKAAREWGKYSTAPDKETPDWMITDFKAGAKFEHSRLLQSAIEKVNKLTPHHYGTRKAVVLDEVLEILNDPSI